MVNPADLLRWGAWRPLATASRDPEIPHRPGLSRIRRVGRDDLDDLGPLVPGLRSPVIVHHAGIVRLPARSLFGGPPMLPSLMHRHLAVLAVIVLVIPALVALLPPPAEVVQARVVSLPDGYRGTPFPVLTT
jgi:hypothetical protein